jgi:hypothetical protein
LAAKGISVLSAASSGNYVLPLPTAGTHKYLLGGTTLKQDVTCTSLSYFMTTGGSTAIVKATFNAANDSLHLVGISSAKWYPVGYSTGPENLVVLA